MRALALPRFLEVASGNDPDPLARGLAVMRAAHHVQHQMIVLEARVRGIEYASIVRGALLRPDLDELRDRVAAAGVDRAAHQPMAFALAAVSTAPSGTVVPQNVVATPADRAPVDHAPADRVPASTSSEHVGPSTQPSGSPISQPPQPMSEPSHPGAVDPEGPITSPAPRMSPRSPADQQPDTRTPAAPSNDPAVPAAGKTSREISVEFGEGSVTGGVTATIEYGQVGIPLGDQRLRTLEMTTTTRINGLVGKLEAALLHGEQEIDLLDGVQITFEADALSVNTDGATVDVNLLTITAKLVGDVGHWIGAPEGVTLTIDGRVSFALGGRLAAKLSRFTIVQLEQRLLAHEIGVVSATVNEHVHEVKKLRAASQGGLSVAALVDHEVKVAQHFEKITANKQHLRRLQGQLSAMKQRANAALRKVQGAVVKQVARAMERRTVQVVAKTLAKLLPVLNVVSTVLDVVDLIRLFRALYRGEYGGDGDDDGGAGDGGAGSGKDATSTTGTSPRDAAVDEVAGVAGVAVDAVDVAAARAKISPIARTLVDAVSHQRTRGVQLTPDQIQMVGLLVPADLTVDEQREVIATLRRTGPQAATGEDAVAAVDLAVRRVRDRKRTIHVNGALREDLSGGGATPHEEEDGTPEGPVTSPSQMPAGPVTSPSQAEDQRRADPAQLTLQEIVESLPDVVVATWFELREGELVPSAEWHRWVGKNVGARVGENGRLRRLEPAVKKSKPGEWRIDVTFWIERNGTASQYVHTFFVDAAGGGPGAQRGGLSFSGVTMITL